ncbi:hypothetical protein DY000_02009481 [Brassica cretica]|uniref:Uncharacterized protein n=1 Tax=Brassica cretica TaxID=69181 RepID=A0ABQ7CGR5_BRACR|nr:hypothetical protein DY000_02009481 [Brassica cretica]
MRMGEDGRAMISATHTGGSTFHAMSQPSPDDTFIHKSDTEALIKAINENSASLVVETSHPDPEGGSMNLNHNRKKEMIQQAHMIKMEMNLISLVKISLMDIEDMKRQL